MFDGPTTVGQVTMRDPYKQVSEGEIKALDSTVPYLMYHNNNLPKWESEQKILNSTTLLGSLFKLALEVKRCGIIPSCSELQRVYS